MAGIEDCQVTTAPFNGTVGSVVWWAHRNPDNPSQFWGWYTGHFNVTNGATVTIRYEGHPVAAIIGYTEAGIGGRYVEFHCGKFPWEIFQDGFENGTTNQWTEVIGADAKRER